MKYLFIMTTSNNVINFRSSMIRFLVEKGHSVTVIAHDAARASDIEKLGARWEGQLLQVTALVAKIPWSTDIMAFW